MSLFFQKSDESGLLVSLEPVEAVTFDELHQYGVFTGNHVGSTIVDDVVVSFTYAGFLVAREDDGGYIVQTIEGMKAFRDGDMLVTNKEGNIYPLDGALFGAKFQAVS